MSNVRSTFWQFTMILVLFVLVSLSSTTQATNGYFRHGYGTQYRGMSGAGVALYLNAMGVATNPAMAAYLSSQFDLGFSLFNPNRQYTVGGAPSGYPGTFPLMVGTVESDSKIFFIPNFGINLKLPAATHAFNLAVFGNGGMNTDYANTATFDYVNPAYTPPTGVDLSQLFVAATYALEVAPNQSLGVSGIFAWQRFRAEGINVFGDVGFSSDPANLSNNDYATSTGLGVRLGYLGQLHSKLSVGASYQFKIDMSAFDEYAGLFAQQGDFDIPANWTVGFAIKPNDMFAAAFDLQKILYSDVRSVGNSLVLPMLPNGQPNPAFRQLGDADGPGFGWDDMTIYKFGLQWTANESTVLRGGYSFTEQPIPSSEVLFNILAPGVIEQTVTLGLSRTLSQKLTLNVALMHGFSNTVSGPNPLDPFETIDLEMNQWEGDISISWKL